MPLSDHPQLHAPAAILDAHSRLAAHASLIGPVEWNLTAAGEAHVRESVDLGGLDFVVVTWLALARETAQVPETIRGAYGVLYLAADQPDLAPVGPQERFEVLDWAQTVTFEPGAFARALRVALAAKHIGLRCHATWPGALRVAGTPGMFVRRLNDAELDRIEHALN